jgi:hypothetical protein
MLIDSGIIKVEQMTALMNEADEIIDMRGHEQ